MRLVDTPKSLIVGEVQSSLEVSGSIKVGQVILSTVKKDIRGVNCEYAFALLDRVKMDGGDYHG